MRKIKTTIKLFLSSLVVTAGMYAFSSGLAGATADEAARHSFITIQKGDTLYRLAKKYGLTVEEIKDLNGLTSDLIFAGEQLLIPADLDSELYLVIGGSFKNKQNAEKQVSNFKEDDIDAFMVPYVIDDEVFYRIQVGAFSKKENAEKQLEALKEFGIDDAYILKSEPLS
ncbi:LysM peptidoglycan-binding domain-containing protein [Mesobacillus maritimus]|uniref:LysM peptidoglycan-binding domain-containing protein n=1 Tax=Mesobacillus maritimus TaxID=1643336 RepID=UPI00203C524E|nr:LysM peptidoglycan-binding domain-containing protein [Mesobacillus maritimus]MCM3585884.1 LysM peptidoglycan-binding domain-containing protein [Mesobacillus maritimus]